MKNLEYLSTPEVITRDRIYCLSLLGKGDPMINFDQKASKIINWMGSNELSAPSDPIFGHFYNNRNDVGVENVVWEACVPINRVINDTPFIFKIFPEIKVLSTTLSEGYEKIGDAVSLLARYGEENDLDLEWPLTEIYLEQGTKPVTNIQLYIK